SRALLSTTMEEETRRCLICSIPIDECHLGIDCCSACAVFYRRIRSTNRPPAKCKGGADDCWLKDRKTTCRKCRFDRFTEVMTNAHAVDEEIYLDSDYDRSRNYNDRFTETNFIDHTSFLRGLPSRSTGTPILDGIRWGYSLMCQIRKCGETATKPADFHFKQGDYDGSNVRFFPSTYSVVVPNARILISAIFEFGKLTFPDFAALNEKDRGSCILTNWQLVNIVDSTYRTTHYFPDHPMKWLASYTTTVDDESIDHHFDDMPQGTNVEEAKELLRKGTQRSKAMSRDVFKRIKPDDIEFLVLFGLSFWNNEVALLNDHFSETTERNRAAILRELNIVYKNRGMMDYATRLGELLCYLDNAENDVSLTNVDIEVYRLLDFFNEAYKHGRTFSELEQSSSENERA
ncbi:hypothetical protein PFISCL1PPCAC_12939, partial [Pristionchus fissidentatus]